MYLIARTSHEPHISRSNDCDFQSGSRDRFRPLYETAEAIISWSDRP